MPSPIWRWGVLTGCLMVLTGATAYGVALKETPRVPANLAQAPDFRQLVTVYEQIRSRSIWRNTPQQLLGGAIAGMVGTLHDRFSDYLPRTQNAQLTQELNPTFGGIGVVVGAGRRGLRVIRVMSDSPAERDGIRPGNWIVRVDGRAVDQIGANRAVAAIRGPVGGQVRLTVSQGDHTRRIGLRRARIAEPTVFSRMLTGHVGYLYIAEFGQNTGREAVAAFHRLVAGGTRGILLDLREDPGGLVTQALTVANLFVAHGPVVTLQYKDTALDHTFMAKGPGTRLPVVVLADGNTASAAEILSAAIVDHHVGILVGTRTYGKGIVQQVVPLGSGDALKLTVARYLTPDGQYIEHVGLRPTIYDPEPAGVAPSQDPAFDPQLRRAIAILRRRMARVPETGSART